MIMKRKAIGRNDPCPCGSGKKYKKCCLRKEETGVPESEAPKVLAELRQAFESQEFDSFEEVQEFADQLMRKQNQGPKGAFQGLSPEQIHRMLWFPFSSPHLVTFPESVEVAGAKPPAMELFDLLIEGIGEKGMKTTAKGNLLRNFCRDVARTYWGEEAYEKNTRFNSINKEADFPELHAVRLTAELAGLVRKYKGKFILSRDCRRILADAGTSTIFSRLLRTYCERFNWAFRDYYSEIPFIQQAFLFSLYLLTRHGGDTLRPQSLYEDNFLKAFPAVVGQVDLTPWDTPEEEVRRCYTLRTLLRFGKFFGLVEMVPDTDEEFCSRYQVKKTPLLDNAVKFHL